MHSRCSTVLCTTDASPFYPASGVATSSVPGFPPSTSSSVCLLRPSSYSPIFHSPPRRLFLLLGPCTTHSHHNPSSGTIRLARHRSQLGNNCKTNPVSSHPISYRSSRPCRTRLPPPPITFPSHISFSVKKAPLLLVRFSSSIYNYNDNIIQ